MLSRKEKISKGSDVARHSGLSLHVVMKGGGDLKGFGCSPVIVDCPFMLSWKENISKGSDVARHT